jgi:hypothetical protein
MPCNVPRITPAEQALFQEWLAEYEGAAAGYATCHLLEALGSAKIAPELRSVIEGHDRYCRVDSSLPLA